ncbi:MAG: alkaline phosphatase D family protein [Geminicoccaceae bacterium]
MTIRTAAADQRENDAMTLSLRCLVLVSLMLAGQAVGQEPALTRIAFGSCSHQQKPQPIWDAVLAYQPELFIFTGDNVYGDVTSQAMTELRRAYAAAAKIEGIAALRAKVPVLATWDDHDYGRNDGGGDFAHRRQAKQLFLDFWGITSDDPRSRRPGVYHAEIVGPPGERVQIILLDTRSFRSPLRPTDQRGALGKEAYLPDPDPAKTMLGEAQWAWLAEQLRAPAELRLLVSSVQVLAEQHGFERWGNLPHERQRLLELITETGAGGVVIVSGDRHIGALYRLSEDVPYALYEITASGLNMAYAHNRDIGPLRLGEVYGQDNFGTIDVDWQAGEVTLSVRGMDGRAVRSATIPIAGLSP